MSLRHCFMDERTRQLVVGHTMKRTTMILAGLMMFSSTAAFAEGGAERMRYYFESLRFSQQQALGQVTQSNELRVPDDQTAQVTEHYKP
jgi:hypothetical protein